ncbi:hypothetical protein BIV25_00190 [Streptomyces sp. MUSC 14]|uniref:hypothetical protein n=1 Tax=Streptomyces sp. MUSC 14 TaxID=1354889 RepID=UPI0008F5CA97|nr:hypothetical protein [Streptomyces sp. MUSC 14]OIK02936.1 hypothetical protein BIV25_00190 [Streptomyces sp. MUSC 14]
MARQNSPRPPAAPRALIALAAAGAALGAGAVTAHAESAAPLVQVPSHPTSFGDADPQAGLAALAATVPYVTGPVAGLKPNPLAGTGVDPLDNAVSTQFADFQPVGTQMLTGPVAEAPSLGSLPGAGRVLAAPGF